MPGTSNSSTLVLVLARRSIAVLTAIAFLFAWGAVRAGATTLSSAAPASTASSTGFIDTGDGERILETADGRWVVQLDEEARQMSVTSPEGEVETFGPDSSIWDEPLPDTAAAANGSSATSSTACTWAVWFVGLLHTSSWGYAVGMLALNPPAAAVLTVIVAAGYGAFWNWVGTHC